MQIGPTFGLPQTAIKDINDAENNGNLPYLASTVTVQSQQINLYGQTQNFLIPSWNNLVVDRFSIEENVGVDVSNFFVICALTPSLPLTQVVEHPACVASNRMSGTFAATYDNGVSGIGATLTATLPNVPLVVGGTTIMLGDNVALLGIPDDTATGCYTLTQQETLTLPWIATRNADMDTPNDFLNGGFFYVLSDDTILQMYNPVAPVIGTDPIFFTNVVEEFPRFTSTNGIFSIFQAHAGVDLALGRALPGYFPNSPPSVIYGLVVSNVPGSVGNWNGANLDLVFLTSPGL